MRQDEVVGGAAALERASRLRREGRPEDALAELRAAVERAPRVAELHHQLGNILKSLGRYEEAERALREAIGLEPDNATVWLNLGVAVLECGHAAEAVEIFLRAVELEPERPEARNVLGHALLSLGRCSEAAEEFRVALRIRSGYGAAHDNLGRVLKAQGRAEEALEEHRAALAAKPDPNTHSNLLYTLNLVPGLRPSDVAEEHRRWGGAYGGGAGGHHSWSNSGKLCGIRESGPGGAGEKNARFARSRVAGKTARSHWAPQDGALHTTTNTFFPRTNEPSNTIADAPQARGGKRARLRIGFVSADFVQHAIAFFLCPFLEARDRENLEVYCYSNARKEDAVTRRIRGLAEHWRNIARISDEEAAKLIGDDHIDILVDLSGHTGGNRLQVFARRPAPVQVTWLGYPNTTGMAEMDFRITDHVCDPKGVDERWHTERLVRLERPFLCYEPPDCAPAVGPLPAMRKGVVTLGCFNNLAKLNGPTIGRWARVLRDLPGARLKLKSIGLADAETAAQVRGQFKAEGVDGERILCDGAMRSVRDHLELYNEIDIALDAHPYNGTTTTCEALLMGVPVATLAGEVHASRVGASLLTAIGRAEWVANSDEAFVERVVALGSDLKGLAEVRRGLRRGFVQSPVCDARGFAEAMLRAFEGMRGNRAAVRGGS